MLTIFPKKFTKFKITNYSLDLFFHQEMNTQEKQNIIYKNNLI